MFSPYKVAKLALLTLALGLSYPLQVSAEHSVAPAQQDAGCTPEYDLFGGFSEEEIDLMAAVVYLEAGNQDMTGKRLVVDVILNRFEHNRFPDTVSGVIDQKGQFSTAKRAHRMAGCAPLDCYGAVLAELNRRLNSEVMFFSIGYGCGKPLFKHGGHCFSAMPEG